MKKVVIGATVLISAALLTGLTACGNTSSNSSESNVAEESAGMANPVEMVSSLEELNEKTNATIIRPESMEVSDESYSLIKGDVTVGEYQFNTSGIHCTLRVANADPSTDISGVYVDATPLFNEETMNTHYVENDDLQAVRWFTVDGQYTLVADDAWDWEHFSSLSEEFMNAEPRNWNSDVPFATYKEMEGYYKDDDDFIASINISLDHVSVNAVGSTDEGNVLWSAECSLKDGKLVYEKATLELNVYDENKGETTTTPYGEEEGGTIELKAGKVIFSGVSSELFKGRSFVSYDLTSM